MTQATFEELLKIIELEDDEKLEKELKEGGWISE